MNYLELIAPYVPQWSKHFINQGMSADWSNAAAKLYLLLYVYGLRPVITSIYRSPEKQAAMRAAYLAGNRQGLRYLPAIKSDHTRQNWLGQPASYAIDIDLGSRNYAFGAQIAHAIGLKTGYEIGDEVHYFFKP